MKTSRWTVIPITAITLLMAAACAMPAAVAGDQDAPKPAAPDARAGGRHGAKRDRLKHFAQDRRQRFMEFLGSLQATDEQRRIVLDKAKAAEPIVAAARAEARRTIAQAWVAASKDGAVDRKALRESLRTQLKSLRERTRTQIEPLAKEVVAALTPDQRTKILAAAANRHARTGADPGAAPGAAPASDDEKLTRFAAFLISRPMTIAYLEARLGR